MAIRVWNALVDGAGGINWAGLPFFVAHFGVADVPALLDRLLILKEWDAKRRAKNGTGTAQH